MHSINKNHNMIPNNNTENHQFRSQEPAKDWVEDFTHENGQYTCKCIECDSMFIGHKRRVICRECSELNNQSFDKDVQDIRAWAAELHKDQKYGEFPYLYHLDSVANNVVRYMPESFTDEEKKLAIMGAYLHDVVSDTGVNRNDIMRRSKNNRLAKVACNLCEDVWGSDRNERNSPGYYKRINSDKISVFVKVCDRISNLQFSYMTKSGMFKKYCYEMERFLSKLYFIDFEEAEAIIMLTPLLSHEYNKETISKAKEIYEQSSKNKVELFRTHYYVPQDLHQINGLTVEEVEKEYKKKLIQRLIDHIPIHKLENIFNIETGIFNEYDKDSGELITINITL